MSDADSSEAAAGQKAFWAGLARTRLGAGALITDSKGRVLMVEPTYKEPWEIPGGSVDAGETARAACRRECLEELSLEVEVGRLLVLEHRTEGGDRGDSIMFIYDGGQLEESASIRLPTDELRSYRFVEPERLTELTSERLAGRIRFALKARGDGCFIELNNGERVW